MSQSGNKIEMNLLKVLLVILGAFLVVLLMLVSQKPKNTQLGRHVGDALSLPAYNKSQDFSKKKYYGVVRVVDSETLKGFCSAFVISDDYAISAAHCFYDKSTYKLNDIEYKIHTETIIDKDTALESSLYISTHVVGINLAGDYALLKGDFKYITKIKINISPFVMSQITEREILPGIVLPLYALGFPNGIKDGAGDIQGPCSQTYDLVTCRGGMFHGMSGGPLLDPSTNEAVGINYAIGPKGDTYFKLMMGLFEAFDITVQDK